MTQLNRIIWGFQLATYSRERFQQRRNQKKEIPLNSSGLVYRAETQAPSRNLFRYRSPHCENRKEYFEARNAALQASPRNVDRDEDDTPIEAAVCKLWQGSADLELKTLTSM